jgi:histidine triad (HIT) family protein
MDCIFCKIANGELKSYILFQDDDVIAFLDVNPVSTGHTLVVPKKHFENIFDIDPETAAKIMRVAQKVSIILKESLHADGVNLLNASGKEAQQSVTHFHMHIVPRYKDDGKDLWFHGDSTSTESLDSVYRQIKSSI